MLLNSISLSIPSPLVYLLWNCHCSIPSSRIGTALFHFVLNTPRSVLLNLGRELLNSHQRSLVRIIPPVFHSTIRDPLFWCSPAWTILLNPHQCSFASIGIPPFQSAKITPLLALLPGLGTLQSPSALHSFDLALLVFISRSSNHFCIVHLSMLHSPSGTPLSLVVAHFFPLNISYCPSYSHLDSQVVNISLYCCQLSHIKRNDIGIPFHPLSRDKKSANTRSAFSVLIPLLNYVLLLCPTLFRGEM